jgi:hypothetical protein
MINDTISNNTNSKINIEENKFTLTKIFNSPTNTKNRVLISLPKVEFLEDIKQHLPKDLLDSVINCFCSLYSYPVEREYVENIETFFHHVAGSVAFENHTKTLIKEKNHSYKAASVYGMAINVLDDVEERMQTVENDIRKLVKVKKNSELTKEKLLLLENDFELLKTEQEILITLQANLNMHINILIQVLKESPTETKEFILTHQKLDVNKENEHLLLTPEKQRVRSIYNSPKGGMTPKNLTNKDKETIEFLKKAQLKKKPKINSNVVKQLFKDHKESNDNKDEEIDLFLTEKVNNLIFSPHFNNDKLTELTFFDEIEETKEELHDEELEDDIEDEESEIESEVESNQENESDIKNDSDEENFSVDSIDSVKRVKL